MCLNILDNMSHYFETRATFIQKVFRSQDQQEPFRLSNIQIFAIFINHWKKWIRRSTLTWSSLARIWGTITVPSLISFSRTLINCSLQEQIMIFLQRCINRIGSFLFLLLYIGVYVSLCYHLVFNWYSLIDSVLVLKIYPRSLCFVALWMLMTADWVESTLISFPFCWSITNWIWRLFYSEF